MWEITLLLSNKDLDYIIDLEKELYSAYPDSIIISRCSSRDDCTLSIAVTSSDECITSFVRVEIAKFILRVVKGEYLIFRLSKYINNDIILRFLASILVSVGSEVEVMSILCKLTLERVNVRSLVYFHLKYLVTSWQTLIDSIISEFRYEREEVIVIEFLKYIVSIIGDDGIDVILDANKQYYMLSSYGNNETISLSKDNEADLIITIINLRPRHIVVTNQHMIPPATYKLIKYVFNPKIRVEV